MPSTQVIPFNGPIVPSQPAVGAQSPYEMPAANCCPALAGKTERVFSANVEYYLWWLGSSKETPALASTNFLSTPGASLLGGSIGDGDSADRKPISGARLSVGYWQVEDNFWVQDGIRDWGVEAVFFFIGQASKSFDNDDLPVIIRPFFDLNNRTESGFIVAAPGLDTGEINVHVRANEWGAEANLWKNVYWKYPGTCFTLAAMVGFRYLSGDDELQMSTVSVYNPNLPPASPFFPLAGDRLDVFDSFTTHNRFYGAQGGLDVKTYIAPNVWFQGDLKLALGVTDEQIEIAGSQLLFMPNGTTKSFTGGLLALPSNIGNFHKDKFAQVPEMDGKLGWAVYKHLTLSLGFTAIYWSKIARAGEQVDRQIDITQIPNFPPNAGVLPTGLNRPTVPFAQSDLWELGVLFGAEIKW
jgi:hypothetical protein